MAGTQEAIQRRILDFRIVRDMECPTFEAEAYRTNADRQAHKQRVVAEQDAAQASKYRFVFRIPTMVDRDVFAAVTEIGVDTDVPDYPMKEPGTTILSSHVPWSPHFKAGLPICIGGEFWIPKQGHVTLGHLALHLARLLNWDEKGRGPGYVGWNGAAVAYHRDRYGGAPLNPDTAYPILPGWLFGARAQSMSFTFLGQQPPAAEFTFLR